MPDVPGIVAATATVGEVIVEMRDALECHLEGLQLAGEPVPEPSVLALAKDVDYQNSG